MKKILIFVVVLIATSLISGISGVQARGISGRVTNASGNGIANVYVGVRDYNNNYWIEGSSTDSDGNYSLKVPAGTYKVRFSQLPSDGYYAPEWYDDRSNSDVADLVTVKGFRTTTNINAQLEIGGRISGRVTDSSGNGIVNVYVIAFDLYGHWMPGSSTDSNGNYSFNMPVGTYKVHFSSSSSSGYYAPEWYYHKDNFEVSDLVTVTAFQTTSNINAQPEMGGTIAGRVTGLGGRGIANVYVYAVDLYGHWMPGSSTDNNGDYRFNVPAGTCKVKFGSSPSNRYYDRYYVPEWYDNKGYSQAADLIAATVLQTTFNINAQLEIGGIISGRVTDASGNGIVGVYVQTNDLNDDTIFFNSATTNSRGYYAIPLAAGSYKVGFFPGPDSGNFASEWYNNKDDFQSADTVTVKRFRESTVNVELQPK